MSNLNGLIEAERSKPHPRWVGSKTPSPAGSAKRPRSAKQAGIKVKDLGALYPFGLTKEQESRLCAEYRTGDGITDLAVDYFSSKLPYAQQRVRKVLAMNGVERRPHPLQRSEGSSRPNVLSGKAANKGEPASVRKSTLRKLVEQKRAIKGDFSPNDPRNEQPAKEARQTWRDAHGNKWAGPGPGLHSGVSVQPVVVDALIDALEIRQAAAAMALKERQPFANVRQILSGAQTTIDALASILEEGTE